jgi:pyruvate kinase
MLAVKMMHRIVTAAESSDVMPSTLGPSRDDRPRGYAAAVTHAARVLAEGLQASAIVGVTRSGLTAEMLSRERARVPIYAFTPEEDVARRLALWWGVTPVQKHLPDDLEATIDVMERHLLDHQFVVATDTVVITGSHPFGVGLHTNFVKFHVLGQAAG